MKLQTIVKETRIISAVHCTPDEMANLLKNLHIDSFYRGELKIEQEVQYDYDGCATPTGLYSVSLSKTVSHFDRRDAAISEFAPEDVAAFGANKSMSFGEKLAELRMRKRMTQLQVATALGISLRAYAAYEHDNIRPRKQERYDKLAEVLGCDANYLRTE